LVTENDLTPEEIEKVHIRSLARSADILADPTKYDPRNRETADHSLPYVIAAAVVDRQVTPVQFTQEKIMDERIRAQLNKVEVVADAEIEAVFPELQRVVVTVFTADGRELTKQLDFPKGDPRNPLTDQEIEGKFDALASPILTEEARRRIKDAVWGLEGLGSIGELMELCIADR
jgi:2-methylcitrate dehydratase